MSRFTIICAVFVSTITNTCWGLGWSMPSYKRMSILQGATSDTETQIAVLVKKKDQPSFGLLAGKHEKHPSQIIVFQRHESPWRVYQVRFTGLKPNSEYHFLVKNEKGEIKDKRTLTTLFTKQKPLTFAMASCMDDSYEKKQEKMWDSLASKGPDILLLIGDNVYADRRNGKPVSTMSAAVLWSRYVETRQKLRLFASEHLIPTIAVWDDHDFGKNNGGREFPLKYEARRVFHSFYAQQPIRDAFNTGPGVSSFLEIAGHRFILMDARSFRSSDPQAEDKTHFGKLQDQWLLQHLETSKNLTWLISGDQWFGGYHKFESFEGNHPDNFAKLLDQIKQTKAKVAFLSGDRHLTELMRIEPKWLGYTTYEITSSGIHAKLYPSSWDKMPNKRQIVGVTEKENFVVITTAYDRFSVTAYGPKDKKLYSYRFKLNDNHQG